MTDDFFPAGAEPMIDLGHQLAVLTRRIRWASLVAVLAPAFERRERAAGEWQSIPISCAAGRPDALCVLSVDSIDLRAQRLVGSNRGPESVFGP